LVLALVGCAGSDAMRVEVYEPAAAHVSYGYGGYAAGGSAWSGYAGTAPTGPLAPTLHPVASVPVDALDLPAPTLLRGEDGQLTFDAGLMPRGALQLTEPGAHPLRRPANFLLIR
jgi:hypothetical protein